MATRIEILKNQIAHTEAAILTAAWVAEMLARLPAMEAAIKARAINGASPWADVQQMKAAVACLGYFTPSEIALGDGSFNPSKVMSKLKAELAELEPLQTHTHQMGSKMVKLVKTNLPGKNGWRASED